MVRQFTFQVVAGVALACAAGYSHNAQAYAVAMPTQWASEAAIEILNAGGNATDAMIAGSFALNVSLPNSMGIGGGGFFLATYKGKTQLFDSRETAPASAHEKMFLDPSGKPIEYYPDRVTGSNPVGIPGMIAGLHEAHRKLGRLPWKRLVEPAIRLAREGVPVTRRFSEMLDEEWPRISKLAGAVALFGDGHGGHLRVGQLLRQPALAQTLTQIANEPLSFYRGSLAKGWLASAAELGVKITEKDLADYKVASRAPIAFKALGLDGLTAAPPSAAGIMVAASLRFLSHYYSTHDVPAADSPARVIVTAETLRHFQELRNATIADPPSNTLDPQKFFDSQEEKNAWKEIEKRITQRRDKIETALTGEPRAAQKRALALSLPRDLPRSHTAHLSVVDDQGMGVAYTTTIEHWFGSGLVVPGYGFLLNNELTDFTAEPGKPNSPAPGKRPRSNMSPTLLFDHGALVGAVGCAGGGRIPSVVVQILENYFIHKMSARAAIAFPRIHPDGDVLDFEKAYLPTTAEKLKQAGYELSSSIYFGTAQIILRRDSTAAWEAAADPVSDGLGIVISKKRK